MQAFSVVFNHFPNWRWTSLPKKYLENEYLTADSAILTNPSDSGSDPPTSTVSSSPAEGGETMGYTAELPLHQVSITISIYFYAYRYSILFLLKKHVSKFLTTLKVVNSLSYNCAASLP